MKVGDLLTGVKNNKSWWKVVDLIGNIVCAQHIAFTHIGKANVHLSDFKYRIFQDDKSLFCVTNTELEKLLYGYYDKAYYEANHKESLADTDDCRQNLSRGDYSS